MQRTGFKVQGFVAVGEGLHREFFVILEAAP